MNRKRRTLRLVLGDQLNIGHSWFKEKSDDVSYVMMEMRQETDYVHHHIQKIIGFFLAMRNFSEELKKHGHDVIYFRINDKENRHDLRENLIYLIRKLKIDRFEYLYPDEYRLDRQLDEICRQIGIDTASFDSEHFISTPGEFEEFFKGKKQYLLESYYRHLRKKHGVLMEKGEPAGGKWNYDTENRKKLPGNIDIPAPEEFPRNVESLLDEIEEAGISFFGNIDPHRFIWPVTREEALKLFDHFLKYQLKYFGTYQDALSGRSWTLFHSRLSFSLNIKLLQPIEIIDKVEQHWRSHMNSLSISQAEGFIRQILGWREYMRGIYWTQMPGFAEMNYFNHKNSLPAWFWTGNTKMNCLSHSIRQSLDFAYAHHIQRLMVTGNFSLLAGIHPDEVDEWYLGIYMDAIQWVEITNTRGMSQYADGGLTATKPYVSSANYIRKMGDYCSNCYYDPDIKTGEKACPFNSLYWHFIERNRDKLESNRRMRMMYTLWDRMQPVERQEILDRGTYCMGNLDSL